MTHDEITETETAKTLHSALAQINILDLPVITHERQMPRKQLAALVRNFFRTIGLKGISVTAPNYSMAKAVDVKIPRRRDYEFEGNSMKYDCEACTANNDARIRVEAILLAAFPKHDDRSDTMTDCYDYKWNVS